MSKKNPQLENGYTRIANDLLDVLTYLAGSISRYETAIVLAIIRYTYGYSRKEAPMSYRLFEAMTGIERRNVARAIKELLYKELIGRTAGKKMKYGKPVYNYRILKSNWCQYDNRTGVNMTTETGVNMTTIKEKKENFKERKKHLVDKFNMKAK